MQSVGRMHLAMAQMVGESENLDSPNCSPAFCGTVRSSENRRTRRHTFSVDMVEWWCFFIGCSSCQGRVYLGYTTLMSEHRSHSPNNAVRCIISQLPNNHYMPNANDVRSPESLQCSYEHARLRSTSRSRHPPFSARHRFPAQRTFGRA